MARRQNRPISTIPATRYSRPNRILYRQWRLIFAIGAANRRLGHVPSSLGRLAAVTRVHLTTPVSLPVAD